MAKSTKGKASKPDSIIEEALRGEHVYMLREGDPMRSRNILFTRCAEEVYCQAELLLLAKKAPINDAPIIGCYLVDATLPVVSFLRSYRDTGRIAEIEGMVEKVRREGFTFPKLREMADMPEIDDKVMKLVPGVEQPSSTPEEEADRQAILKATVAHYLPEFVVAVEKASAAKANDRNSMMALHQDAFAAGYHVDEYTLLGMAIKYAGLYGVDVMFQGKNHETFTRADQRSTGMTHHSKHKRKHKLVPINRDPTPEDFIGAKVVSVELEVYGQLVLIFDNDRAITALSTDGESSFFYSVEPLP